MVDIKGVEGKAAVKRPHSISLRRNGRGALTPFNVIKMELAVILVAGILLIFLADRISPDPLQQLGMLAFFGVGGMVWTMARVYRLSQQAIKARDRQHGAD